jgi:hypothetical protein
MTETADFLRWLKEACGYAFPVELPDGRYACIHVRWHNTQIITGRIGDMTGWDDAW